MALKFQGLGRWGVKVDSLIVELILLAGVGDIDNLCIKYIGMAYHEFKHTASISCKVSG